MNCYAVQFLTCGFLFANVLASPLRADRPTTEPTSIEDVLPSGAVICEIEHWTDSGQDIYRQDAVFRSGLKGDGTVAQVVIYVLPSTSVTQGDELHVAILEPRKGSSQKWIGGFHKVQDVRLPGEMLFGQNFSTASVSFFPRSDKGVDVCFATQSGASTGPFLTVLSWSGQKKAYLLHRADGDFFQIHRVDSGFEVAGKDGKTGRTMLNLVQGPDGATHFQASKR